MTNFLVVLWKISRPHVIYGTILSFIAFSLIEFVFMWQISPSDRFTVVIDNFIVFLYYLFGNQAIQCQNQLTDEKSDRVNKPYLPLPSKQVTREQLKMISMVSYALYGGLTVFYFGLTSVYGLCGVVAIALSSMYSLPPFNLKQIPLINSAVIIICRPIIYHTLLMVSFTEIIEYKASRDMLRAQDARIYLDCLNSFYYMQCCCIIAVCLYKDVPDMDGDKKVDGITTLPMLLGKHVVFGLVILTSLIAVYVADMKPSILGLIILVCFVPMYVKWHAQDANYAKAYFHIWNFFYLNIASFVLYACIFV